MLALCVAGEFYSRYMLCTLNLIFTIFLLRKRTTIQLKPPKSGSWLWLELYYGIGRAYFLWNNKYKGDNFTFTKNSLIALTPFHIPQDLKITNLTFFPRKFLFDK
jgi:hypothetical protein